MLDDSASDNSSTLQSLGTSPAPLRPSPPPLVPTPQVRGPKPDNAAGNAGLQQMVAMSNEEDENDVQGLQMLSQQSGSNSQQMTDMSNQLQVSGARVTLGAYFSSAMMSHLQQMCHTRANQH